MPLGPKRTGDFNSISIKLHVVYLQHMQIPEWSQWLHLTYQNLTWLVLSKTETLLLYSCHKLFITLLTNNYSDACICRIMLSTWVKRFDVFCFSGKSMNNTPCAGLGELKIFTRSVHVRPDQLILNRKMSRRIHNKQTNILRCCCWFLQFLSCYCN